MPVACRGGQIALQLENTIMNRRLLLCSFCVSTVLTGWQLAAQSSQDPPPQQAGAQQDKPPETPAGENPTITLPEGYVTPVRVTEEVDSKHGRSGEMYSGSVDPSVLIDDKVVIPRGTEAHLRLIHNKKGGHLHGKAEVTLELVSLIINGQRLEVDSNARSKKKGALESKGSAIAKKAPGAGGVVTGDPSGAAGPVIAAFSAAKVEVKAGSRIEFKLESPFTFERPPINPAQP
jgi:hypothetical protein